MSRTKTVSFTRFEAVHPTLSSAAERLPNSQLDDIDRVTAELQADALLTATSGPSLPRTSFGF
jgi:hypothetical protein